MLTTAIKPVPRVRNETADFSIQLVGDGAGILCAQLETYDNRWPIRTAQFPEFVNGVRELMTKGRRRLSPWSVDGNLDCEVAYRVIETPEPIDTDRGTKWDTDRRIEIESLTVIYRERRHNTQTNLHSTLEYGRVQAGKELLDDLRDQLADELIARQ